PPPVRGERSLNDSVLVDRGPVPVVPDVTRPKRWCRSEGPPRTTPQGHARTGKGTDVRAYAGRRRRGRRPDPWRPHGRGEADRTGEVRPPPGSWPPKPDTRCWRESDRAAGRW